MNVCWVTHLWPPEGAAGAEWTAHAFMRAAAARGHGAYVQLARKGVEPYNYQGVVVSGQPPEERMDLVIGHLGNSPLWQKLARRDGARSAWMVHAEYQYAWARAQPDVWLANSGHVMRAHPDALLLYPVVDPERVFTQPDRSISERADVTLINGTIEKGAALFNELAAVEPERSFTCVEGAYGRQVVWQRPNLRVLSTRSDMRQVYAETRVLLAPSESESWCMVAVEAGINGIPVIAHPSAGLHEAMGDSIAYRDRSDIEAWRAVLRQLDDPTTYAEVSRLVWDRAWAAQDWTEAQLVRVLDALLPE